MTAVYWAWKNIQADYIGLCHYRRILTFRPTCGILGHIKKKICYLYGKTDNLFHPGKNVIDMPIYKVVDSVTFKQIAHEFEEDIKMYLTERQVEAIVPHPIRFSAICVRQFFDIGLEPRLLMDDIVREISPQLYPYYQKSQRSNLLFAANIFVMRHDLFEDYCKTIFPILEEHEKRTIESGWCNDLLKEKCYSRRSGYFSEFLTSAYIFKLIHENRKVEYANVAFLDLNKN